MSQEKSFFHEAIAQIVAMHEKKAHDYTSTGEFGNFEESAKSADIEVYQAIEALIATKEARIRTINRNNKAGKDVHNEPLIDSYLDRAVYAIISYAYVLSVSQQYKEQYEKKYPKPGTIERTIDGIPESQLKRIKMTPEQESYVRGMQASVPNYKNPFSDERDK